MIERLLDKIAKWGFDRTNKKYKVCCDYCNATGFSFYTNERRRK